MTVKLKINGRELDAPDGQLLIEACREAGVDVPRYCYHPGLGVVGSCRMCLVEIEGEGKLIPSCQTPVRAGVNVLTESEKVKANQRAVLEYLLLNHPLDCPVCDQAGECYLQDYSYTFGRPFSRFAEDKIKQPKKDVGPHIILYMDRCVLCSRCVRFTREVAGTGELCVTGRGSNCEIDIFPGRPLANKLSGCIADICPVGALLDKHFLHRQRVWNLAAEPSVCARCSAGCNINIFHNDGRIWRLKPRENHQVNDWWMCDDGRYGWEYVHAADRLDHLPRVRRAGGWETLEHADAAAVIAYRLRDVAGLHGGRPPSAVHWTEGPISAASRPKTAEGGCPPSEKPDPAAGSAEGPGSLAAVLSPMWTTEEQFLLAELVRGIDPAAVLAVGPAPMVGGDETFKAGFTIRAEKCPNRRGAERVLAAFGGPRMTFDELLAAAAAGTIKGLYLAGGYPPDVTWGDPPAAGRWLNDAQLKALATPGLLLIVEDLFAGPAFASATIALAGASWAEKSGTFVNVGEWVQRLSAAPVGPEHVRPAGELLWGALGRRGPLVLSEVWSLMAAAGVAGYPPARPEVGAAPAARYRGPGG